MNNEDSYRSIIHRGVARNLATPGVSSEFDALSAPTLKVLFIPLHVAGPPRNAAHFTACPKYS